jgi:hypothetical protein
MAGQPPSVPQPGYVPDDLKPWYKSRAFRIPAALMIPTAVVGTIVALILNAPTSDGAAILVDWPCMPNDRQIQVSGSGWDGDKEVEIDLPQQTEVFSHRALVTDGSFSDRRFEVRPEQWGPLDVFVVTVRGLQSHKQLVRDWHTASGAGSCGLD